MTTPQFLLLAAMPEEREPFLQSASQVGTTRREGAIEVTPVDIAGHPGEIMLTGIGPIAAASSLTAWLSTRDQPQVIISVGSAGGLHSRVKVGQVIIGHEYRYADVDAQAFGYHFGQVPGQPPAFTTQEVQVDEDYVHTGLIVTSSSFVSADLAIPIREHFPHALAVDMESTALAQVCHRYGAKNFVSIRGISDLCTPVAGEDFHDGLGTAAERSRQITHKILTQKLG